MSSYTTIDYTNNPWGGKNTWGSTIARSLAGGAPTAEDPWSIAGGEGANQVNSWMNQSLGAQRNATDDYVKRAATTGVQRGGMGVAGGQNWGAGLQQGAVKALASGAADRFTGASNYLNQQNQLRQQAAGTNAGLYGQLSGQYQTALTSEQQMAAQAALQASQQDWQGLQNTQLQQAQLNAHMQQQEATAALQQGQQAWQGGQNTQQQGWTGAQNTQQQQAALAAQMAQQGWQGGQNTQLQNWNTAQNALNRQQTQSGLNQTQLFQLMMSQLGG
jgi:hypothetical protein